MDMILLDGFWGSLTSTEQVFWGIAIFFSVLFLIQFVLSLIGLDFDADVDVPSDIDVDFSMFSVRGIIAFFTFFGWTGVMALRAGQATWVTLGLAVLSGLIAMFIVGYLMYLFSRLGQVGNIDMAKALYKQAEVYLTIPAQRQGSGKVHLTIKGSLREVDAVTEGDALPTGVAVRIVEVLESDLLLVEPARNGLALNS